MNGLLMTCNMVTQEACVFTSEEGMPRIYFKTKQGLAIEIYEEDND